MRFPARTRCTLLVLALSAGSAMAQQSSFQQLRTVTPDGIPAGGPYVPAGSLYDNEQSDGTTSLASQDSSGTLTARTADDFILAGTGCGTGNFDITQIRVQMVQADAAPQAFAVDLFADNGSNTAPVSGINPIATVAQSAQTTLGAFGAGTSIIEATFIPTGLSVAADTRFWLSGYGTNAAANAAGFNNFFAASAGASGTTDNGVIIAPGAGVADWTAAEAVIGGNPLAFSFAIDGVCSAPLGPPRPVPASNSWALVLAGLMLGLIGVVSVRRAIA